LITGSTRQIRVWPGQSSAFARHPFSVVPFGGLHTHLHTRLQGARLHHHIGRHGGLWSGVLFWPYASWDFFDYTFDPTVYESFWPYPLSGSLPGHFRRSDGQCVCGCAPYGSQPNGRACNAAALGPWPVEQIAQRLKLTDAQRAAFDALNDAANGELGPSCTGALPETPTSRIEAMRVRLVAMWRAVESMRPSLARFYALLNDAQKAQLNSPAMGGAQCGEDLRMFPTLSHDRIVRELQTNAAQRAALRELQHALMVARDMTQAPCTGDDRLTVVARLDRIEARLNAALRAVEVIEPAFTAFYGLLGDEQKKRFNRIAAQSG
jgi:hypothetical protein